MSTYSQTDADRATRVAQLHWHHQHAEARHPAVPRPSVRPLTKKTADFTDGDHRMYQIMRHESDVLDLSAVPVYCNSTSRTRSRLRDVYSPGSTIELFTMGGLVGVIAESGRARIVSIGQSSPRGSYTGRLVLDLASGFADLTMASIVASAPTPPSPMVKNRRGQSALKKGRLPRKRPGRDPWAPVTSSSLL
jgi:hypothetical protein